METFLSFSVSRSSFRPGVVYTTAAEKPLRSVPLPRAYKQILCYAVYVYKIMHERA